MAPIVLRFGVYADCQYSTAPDQDEPPCYYASSLGRLEKAVEAWGAQAPLEFVLNCGDTVDGGATAEESLAQLRAVAGVIAGWEGRPPFVHAIGNHCLINIPRAVLHEFLDIPGAGYEMRELPDGWALIVLDTTEISVTGGDGGWPLGHDNNAETQEFLKHHPIGSTPCITTWNGTLSKKQAAWLDATLAARPDGKKTLIAMHHPVVCPSAIHQVWNPEELLRGFEAHASKIHTVFNGHYHEGHYEAKGGIHYVGVRGMLSFRENAYGVVTVDSEGTVVLDGCGTAQASYTLKPLEA
eukprot:TRINITY_DN14704_c0_g1_i1.p1 TRINITY_DN14704_c0_g1~~TRINITY_DN14704_c0_g1_i1.p1  ORF type:complete len:332 (+),score=79.46 TRINITY_DN14704_c0_g1_i1:106-996(+)